VNERRLLLPARWPNARPTDAPKEAGLPEWASCSNTHKSWSFPDGKHSGRMTKKGGSPDTEKRRPGAYAKFLDAGGTVVEKVVEVEEGQFETIKRVGPGFLNETNISVEGANIVVVYGKGSVESGVVYSHRAGSNEFEFHHPQCDTEGYGSCKKGFWKTEFVSYFFENALTLLDSPFEYYFERRSKGGNRLFLKLNSTDKPSVRLWGRHNDYFLHIQGSANFTVRGVRTFATQLTTAKSNPGFKIVDNTFLYPSSGTRLLGNYGKVRRMLINQAHDARIINNTWMYAEGTAFEAQGVRMTMSDNFFKYNGIYSTDGPQTIKWNSVNGTVSHNSLEWNGQVTGWKLMGEGQLITRNHVQHQNWGKTLHDGAGIHVQMSAGASTFSFNWVHDGHASLGIRFDTSSDAPFKKPEDIGHDAQVHHNVLWGRGTSLAMKGERMNVTSNTILGGSIFQLIRAFGVQQGMHKLTMAALNALESPPVPRGRIWAGRRRTSGCDKDQQCMPGAKGWTNEPDSEAKETRPKGPPWQLPQGAAVDNNLVSEGLCWDGLQDCLHRNFRPRRKDVSGNGAYDWDPKRYWLPGRRGRGPSSPMPENGAQEVSFDSTLALAFQPSATCPKHYLSLTWENNEKPKSITLTDGANLWQPGPLPKGTQFMWTVTPADELGCTGSAVTWRFSTASSKRTTIVTTTTTTAKPCQDLRVVRETTEEKKEAARAWCKSMSKKCDRSNVRNYCAKTCKLCSPTTPAPTPAPTKAPTPMPTKAPTPPTKPPTTAPAPSPSKDSRRRRRRRRGGSRRRSSRRRRRRHSSQRRRRRSQTMGATSSPDAAIYDAINKAMDKIPDTPVKRHDCEDNDSDGGSGLLPD